MNLTPILMTAGIVAGVSLLGFIISYLKQSRAFRGYEDYASDAQSLASRLKAEVFRDGIDLVISGNYGRLPAIVRFSYADNTPGLNIRMKAPANFGLSIAPKGGRASEGRVLLRTPDETFDARYVTRTDYPTQARLFVGGKAAFAQMQKLCCSSQTFLTISTGSVELSELTIPTPYAGKHIEGHLDSMAALAKSLQAMPGADAIKITPYRKEHSTLIRAALAVGVLTAIVVVIGAMHDHRANSGADASYSADKPPEGISFLDAQRIPGVQAFRLAGESDFDPDARAWARSHTGHDVSGRVEASLMPANGEGTAYVLVRTAGANTGTKRVLLLAGNEIKYDAGYPELAIIGKVPHDNFNGIPWVGQPSAPDGDGILLVRKRDDLRSGVIIYLSGGRLETAIPSSYLNVSID